jgi:NitT/TauT family transport system permease protein
MNNRLYWALPLITGVLMIGIWYAIKWTNDLPHYILPSPDEIIRAGFAEKDVMFKAARETIVGAVIGFLSAGSIGFALALILSSSSWIKASLYPWVLFLQMIPVIVMVPIFVLWLGPGLPSVAIITFMIGFFPIVANTTQGLISTEKNMVDLFTLYNASKLQEIFFLRVPYALPYFLTGLKIAASLAVIGALTGEIFAGSASGSGGLGFMVVVYNSQLKIPELFATAIVACALGFIFVSMVLVLSWYLLRHWHESVAQKDS